MLSRADTVNLSNMAAISEEVLESGISTPPGLEEMLASTKGEQWKITKFETTPPMSTYIVAFANGHFDHLETSVVMPLSKKTVPLRIYGWLPLFFQANLIRCVIQPHRTTSAKPSLRWMSKRPFYLSTRRSSMWNIHFLSLIPLSYAISSSLLFFTI